METLEVLSVGGGRQSSALLLMSCAGVLPKLDAAIFADTQGEMPATYEHIEYLRQQAEAADIPFVIVSKGSLYDDIIDRAGIGMQPNPPVRVRDEDGKLQRINNYFCSYDYKRRVVTAEVKRICGPRGAWRETNVRQWIGYSAEEASRMKDSDECRCTHKLAAHDPEFGCHVTVGAAGQRPCVFGPPGPDGEPRDCMKFDPWQTNVWPLIEMNMTSNDAVKWMTDRGHPIPPRSACWFCPNRGNSHWRELRRDHPQRWEWVVSLDEFVRTGLNGLKGEAFIHQSGIPIKDVDFGDELDESSVAYDCDAGVCFT